MKLNTLMYWSGGFAYIMLLWGTLYEAYIFYHPGMVWFSVVCNFFFAVVCALYTVGVYIPFIQDYEKGGVFSKLLFVITIIPMELFILFLLIILHKPL